EVLRNRSPKEVIQTVNDSGIRGLGGAGYPAGRKWSQLKADAPFPRYVIANTDEMEPGTYKDRVLIFHNPHTLIEGLLIAGYAVSAEKGYVFIRPAYESSARVLEKAVKEARRAGLVGRNILGSPYSMEVIVHRSAGRYICGEAKGLIHALEGKRPHPNIEGHLTDEGLWGRPTMVNNAETLSYVPHILKHGAEWFRSLGKNPDAPGRKIYSVSGRVVTPGCYELPFGTALSEIIEDHAGGMQPGFTYKTCLPGGASTRFLPKAHYRIGMDFKSFSDIGHGHRFGTGAIMVFDQKTCLVGATLNLIQFFARESCGFCTPCREGLPYIKDLLQRLEDGEGETSFIPRLHQMACYLFNAYCAFAPGAATPLLALLEDFSEEIHEHISQRKCPYKNRV
ncbi:MAG TPA: NADH-ubiquinone oxidoreductase-F iron-sulfur binding region domain-containing protein, partial [Thermodesulfobacteriota bacterium]|nr:NADH-ubiquinone oxidoreductase-F iron-sulfur binding region domain-containing protein [Thermodesulfobacteriota bacterium]